MTQKEERLLKKFAKDINGILGDNLFHYEIHPDGEIYITFPNEDEYSIESDISALEIYFDEISSIKIHPHFKVTTNLMTQRVVKVSSQSNFYALLSLGLLSKKTTENIWIRLVDNPILIGIAATKEKQYDNYNPPCSNHLAVEIIYPSLNVRLSDTDEEKLIKIFMFELAHFHQISFEFASFKISDNLDIEDLEVEIRQSFDF